MGNVRVCVFLGKAHSAKGPFGNVAAGAKCRLVNKRKQIFDGGTRPILSRATGFGEAAKCCFS